MKRKLLSSLLTTLVNTGIVTFVLTAMNSGLPFPLLAWLKIWALAAAIIYPLSLFVPGRMNALSARLLGESDEESTKEATPK